jgi:thioredoxin reductase (NADPH)
VGDGTVTDCDILVVGGGLAGLTAGLFAARLDRATLVLEPAIPGGQLVNIEKVEDFPGFPEGVAGFELGPVVQQQAANAGAEFRMAAATGLRQDGESWLVTTDEGDLRSRAVIVATGSRARALGVPGEDRFAGRGISHCASCDGPLFRGKTVGVVGGGDSALQEALTLANHVDRVAVFHRGERFSGQDAYLRRVVEVGNITCHMQASVEEIFGSDGVESVRVRHLGTGEESHVELAGLFVYVGLRPNTELLEGLVSLDESGHVPTDGWLRAGLPGLFAAGDIRRDSAAQAITSAGDGATAAVAAHRYLQQGGD